MLCDRIDGRGMPTSTHIRLAPVAIVVLALVGAAGLHSSPARARSSSLAPYSWPVKPFDRQHPIRGSFGDPRTAFAGPPTQRTLLSGTGAFSFHAGVDISAPDGTAVYPVESGTVKVVMKDWIQVDSGNGRSFQYWHIASAVSIGQHVAARSTVLGHILRSCGHVHLTEMDGTEPTNPLAVGHLTPYDDTSVPVTSSISFLTGVSGRDLMPELLRGRGDPRQRPRHADAAGPRHLARPAGHAGAHRVADPAGRHVEGRRPDAHRL